MKYFVSLILFLVFLTAFGSCQQERVDKNPPGAGREDAGKKGEWNNSILAKIENNPVTILKIFIITL